MNETIPPPLDAQFPAQPPKTSALAIWSLVLGILGIVLSLGCIGILFSIPAVICGHMAYSRIKRSTGRLAGEGLALGGMITGYGSTIVSLVCIPLLMAIAIPNFIRARDTAQMNACINNLRQIDAAKNQWASENNKTTNAVPTMQDLNPYLKNGAESLHCPAGGTYTIGPVGESPTCSNPKHHLPEN